MASSQGGDVELTAPAIAGVTGVIHDEAASQFVIRDSAAGTPAAFVEYSVAAGVCGGCKGGTIDLFHTFSDPAFRGKGLAGHVVEQALRFCRDRGLRAVPTCSYVAHFVKKHPEWADVVQSAAVRPTSGAASAAAGEARAAAADSTAAAAAPDADGPHSPELSEAAREAAHSAHIFALGYNQYAQRVYARGAAATESTPAMAALKPDADPVLASRMASLCARRAAELDEAGGEAPDGPGSRSADSLRLEASHVLTLLAASHPDMDWTGSSTGEVVDDLERRGFLLGFRDAVAAGREAAARAAAEGADDGGDGDDSGPEAASSDAVGERHPAPKRSRRDA
ncbi:hypothetical protein FNF29_00973 [Cafeteria roenbergensis]|uniref:N-acetyltransferase domain-containing protein n=1 Tax=Cafeteria roenbergensis TaxID=33653 RepID=A0A5A8CWI6_CAFRO|nr:hypothetical protein FNF29_00973 [Cafeteria roenbergensis]|eukprot:KAA0156864.1 hypothetical protein FNF29_00973 [Cafeteria roenbergensis]